MRGHVIVRPLTRANPPGAANIGDAGQPAKHRIDREIVPVEATRPSMDEADYHTGRGGVGNEHVADDKGKKPLKPAPQGLADKLKGKIFGVFKK